MIRTAEVVSRVKVWDERRVRDFDKGADEVLVVEREVLSGLAAVVRGAVVREWRGRVTRSNVEAIAATAVDRVGVGYDGLVEDVTAVAQAFLDQFAAAEASLRLEILDSVGCPKFHCDNVRMRLVLTYHGPGTEFVSVSRPSVIQQAPTGAFVFLKGHKHPTYRDSTLHRSPRVPSGEKRLCLILDV